MRLGKNITFIPTIDISKGRAVLVKNGKVNEDNGDPLERAKQLSIHNNFQVVDLDRAMGTGQNKAIIFQIAQMHTCYVAGGIKTFDDAAEMLNHSAKRVVVSTMASPELLAKIPKDRVIVAFDIDEEYNVYKKGRLELTKQSIFDRINALKDYISVISVTFHFTEGCNSGIPKAHIEKIQDYLMAMKIDVQLIIAGGITTLDDISYLIAKKVTPQFGAGFYKGNFTLGNVFNKFMNEEKQIKFISKEKQALYPAIILSKIGTIINLVYVNRKQIEDCVDKRKLSFYEIKENEFILAIKTHEALQIVANCDQTSLVVVTTTPSTSECEFDFEDPTKGSLMYLEEIIKERLTTSDPSSYTKKIFGKPNYIACKIIEESTELWNSKGQVNIQYELADLLYFLVLYSLSHGISMGEINRELVRRHFEITRRNIGMLPIPAQLKLGICLPNYEEKVFENALLQYGIYAKRDISKGSKCLKFESNFIKHPDEKLISCVVKPKDIFSLMQMGYIDFAICLKQYVENYPVDFIDLTKQDTENKVTQNIVIIAKKGIDLTKPNYKFHIFSEYSYFTNIWADERGIKAKVTPLSGNGIEFLVCGLCDMCCCEMPNQELLNENDLEVVSKIYQSTLGLFCRKEVHDRLMKLL